MRYALCVLLLVSACKKEDRAPARAAAGPLPATSPFWTWFRANSAALATVEGGHEPIAGQLAEQLHALDLNLTYELGPKAAPRELIISAGGIRTAFPAVEQLVAAAPPLPGWKVIAFRQRKPPGLSIKLGDAELDPAQVWFTATPDSKPGLIALSVFIRGMTPQSQEVLTEAMFILLDSVLGEHDVETKLGAIEAKAAPTDTQGLRPIGELAKVVDGWR